MKNSLIEYKKVVITGQYGTTLFVSDLINQLCERVGKILNEKKIEESRFVYDPREQDRIKKRYTDYGKIIIEIGSLLQESLIDKLRQTDLCENDVIIKEKEEDATNYCVDVISSAKCKQICDEYVIVNLDNNDVHGDFKNDFNTENYATVLAIVTNQSKYINKPKNRYKESFDDNLFVFALVIDRDHKCKDRKPMDFKQLIEECSDNKISLYITNPAFEFWLIMHFEDLCCKIDDKKMKDNDKERRGKILRNYAEWKLDDYFSFGYDKVKLPYNKFVVNECEPIKKAINVPVSNYTDKNDELLYRIGSSVGLLLERMINNN